jgi:hypothetical protein
MKRIALLALLSVLLLSSCYVNRVTVGYGPQGAVLHDRTFSKVKSHYLFWGLLTLGDRQPELPPTGVGFQVKSGFTLGDGLVSIITGGIYSSRTVKILVNTSDEKAIKEREERKR